MDSILDKNKKCVIMLTTNNINEAIEYYQAGTNYVMLPNELSGKHGSTLLETFGLDVKKFLPLQIEHLEKLHKI